MNPTQFWTLRAQPDPFEPKNWAQNQIEPEKTGCVWPHYLIVLHLLQTNKQTLFSWLFYLLFIYLESLQPYSYHYESGVLHHLQKEAGEWIIDLLMLS